MPDGIARVVAKETDENRRLGVIPRLACLEAEDQGVEKVYFCDAALEQVYKLKHEGQHFCGYRNMQMLLSSLPSGSTTTSSTSTLPHPDPMSRARKATVLTLQSLVEAAWTAGHNSHSRIETGGILNTRKHVGTSEAEALFAYLGIRTTARVFHGKGCWRELLDYVQHYFSGEETVKDPGLAKTFSELDVENVKMTSRPPIFLQRPRHSLTIVGIEVAPSGKRRLIVFDPGYNPPASLVRAMDREDRKVERGKEERVLTYCRRGERYLRRFDGFEILHVQA